MENSIEKEKLEKQLEKIQTDLKAKDALLRSMESENHILKANLETAKVEQIKQIAADKGISYAQACSYYKGA